MTARLGRQFGLLWTGQTVSNVGDRVTLFVVPTLMIFLLGASAFQVGLVSMAQYLAIPVLALVAGGLVDRWDLRALLIACDLVRFAAIALIPVAYWLGFLSIPLMFVCVLVVSAATVFFNTGYIPTVAMIVEPRELVRANSRLETSRTAAELGGPAVASFLFHLLGAASLVADAVSYLFSAACIRSMRPVGVRDERRESLITRLGVGIRQNWRNPILRRSTAGTLLANIGGPIFVTQMPVLAYQGLHLSVGVFGTVMTIAAVGSVLGAMITPRISERIGNARTMTVAMTCHSASGLGILLAPMFPSAVVLAVTLALYRCFFAWYNICSQSVRQRHMPAKDQAVIFGAYRTVTWGVIPISVFVGGLVVSLLARHFDILHASRIAMACATVIGISAFIPLSRLQPLLDEAEAEQEREPEVEGVR